MHIEIEVVQVEPPTGWVSRDGEPPVSFAGWLPLLGILERLTGPPAGEELRADEGGRW